MTAKKIKVDLKGLVYENQVNLDAAAKQAVNDADYIVMATYSSDRTTRTPGRYWGATYALAAVAYANELEQTTGGHGHPQPLPSDIFIRSKSFYRRLRWQRERPEHSGGDCGYFRLGETAGESFRWKLFFEHPEKFGHIHVHGPKGA